MRIAVSLDRSLLIVKGKLTALSLRRVVVFGTRAKQLARLTVLLQPVCFLGRGCALCGSGSTSLSTCHSHSTLQKWLFNNWFLFSDFIARVLVRIDILEG